VRLRGARVSGRLDLMGGSVACPLVCEYCHFDDELRFVESSTRTVRIVDSRFPVFNGTRMQADGIVNLWGCVVPGMIRLDQAKITGELCLRGATVGAGGSSVAVSADGLSVNGDVECAALTTHGAVSMQGAQVAGSIYLTDARISCPGTRALMAGNATIGGRLVGRGLLVEGETLLHDTTIGSRVELDAARLHNPGATVLSAGGITVTGGMFCTGGFEADGEIRMIGARLGANLALNRATLTNPGGTAMNLDRAQVGDLDGSDLICSGQISLVGARIAGGLNLARAQLDSGAGQPALVADGATIDGTLRLEHVLVRGEVAMRTGTVGRRVLLTGARLENPDGIALLLSGTEVAADVFCRDMTAIGGLRLAGTRIRSHLDLDRARLIHPSGNALDARALQAGELSLQPAGPVQGAVDLSHARIGVLRDDPATWPRALSLGGLTYQVLEPQLPARQRLRWIARHPHGHEPQPYEQLAAYYTGIGQPAQARRVLYARERLQRRAGTPLARTWSLIQDVTVAYGYQPWRAVLWLALLLATGSVIFTAAPPPPLQPGAAPHFNPVTYTLDLLLPVVDLGQKHAFNPAGAEQWFSYLLTAAGWVLATTIAAGAARVLSRR
jgi:hypothetical protein